MSDEKLLINQYRHETETWRRTLGFITEENITIKNRISEIVRNMNAVEPSSLEAIEFFQNCFVEEDKEISRLRSRLKENDNLLSHETYVDGKILKNIRHAQEQLRKEMDKNEKSFNRLKSDFNKCLSEILLTE